MADFLKGANSLAGRLADLCDADDADDENEISRGLITPDAEAELDAQLDAAKADIRQRKREWEIAQDHDGHFR